MMKYNLSRKEITRCIVNGFEVYMKYRVDLGSKIWKNGTKPTLWHFSVTCTGTP